MLDAWTIVACYPDRTKKGTGMRFTILPLLLCSVAVADERPIHEWRFTPATQSRSTFAPRAGDATASLTGKLNFGKEAPRGLELSGDGKNRNRLIVAEDHNDVAVPIETLTVEAWVRVDKTQEWGGIVSCLQDNGSFERGWLLGFRHTTFCFAVTSQKTKKLTYLTSSRMFEPGYWYHVAGTYDGKQMKLFVDGRLAAKSSAQSGPIAYPEKAPFVVGAYEDENEYHPLKGAIEQASVWNTALGEADIADRFRQRQSQFPGIIAEHPDVTDWPTHLRDNQRTGLVTYDLKLPLHLNWVHQQPTLPSPAWPAPASQDFWHKKFNLKARVVYDRASHLVTAGGRVFFGSSSDDTLYCLSARTGEKLWSYTTEGPIRLAPTVVGDRVLAGSDDGHVYCLSTTDGKLLWKHRAVDEDRRIPGNERIISTWPIRTGVMVDEGTAYFCAGLFPQQGVYQVGVDVRTGERLGEAKLDISAQGYLARRSGQLYVATGRDPAGKFVSRLKRTGKGVGREMATIPEQYRDVFIGSKNLRIGGGENQIAAFSTEDGKQLWHAKVDGKVWSMAITGNRLLVSTDSGRVYCFSDRPVVDEATSPPTQAKASGLVASSTTSEPSGGVKGNTTSPQINKLLTTLTTTHNIDRGYALLLNGTDKLAIPLAAATRLQIICYQPNQSAVQQTRAAINAAGLQQRIRVHLGDPTKQLPYSDYLFNVVIDQRVLAGTDCKHTAEIKRVTRPLGGVAVCSTKPNGIHVRGRLEGTGEWSHMYANPANTVCSNDEHVGADLQLHWFGRPGPQQMLDRHHRTVAPLWKNGRLFIPGNDRVIGVDAYNGTPLWNVEAKDSRRIGAYRDSSYMAATDDRIYVAAKNECLVLNALTGDIEERLKVPGDNHEWGYLAVDANGVIGTSSKLGAIRRGHSLEAINEGTFWDARPLVTSDRLFHRGEGDKTWEYLPAEGSIPNSSITVSGSKVFAVESTNTDTLKHKTGRIKPTDIFSKGSKVTAIERDGGSVAWSVDLGLDKIQHNIHTAFADGKLVVVGSRNSTNDKKTGEVLYDVYVLNAENRRRDLEQDAKAGNQNRRRPRRTGSPPRHRRRHAVLRTARLQTNRRHGARRIRLAKETPPRLRHRLRQRVNVLLPPIEPNPCSTSKPASTAKSPRPLAPAAGST